MNEDLKVKQQAWEQVRYTAMLKSLPTLVEQCEEILSLFEFIENQQEEIEKLKEDKQMLSHYKFMYEQAKA